MLTIQDHSKGSQVVLTAVEESDIIKIQKVVIKCYLPSAVGFSKTATGYTATCHNCDTVIFQLLWALYKHI